MPELSELQMELRRLAAERDAVILAHNYQRPEVQAAADYTGDSLELARIAAADDRSVILFCGVHFMAETAHILSPEKTVLMPDKRAGCPMADMVTVAGLRALKQENPDAVVVAYVNTSAAIKAETDVCCTSANAVAVVDRFPRKQEIIFVPDRNLGDYVARQTGRLMAVSQQYRYRPVTWALNRQVQNGAIGELGQARLDFYKGWYFDDSDFRRTMPDPLLADMAIHHFDLLRFITGLEATSVHGESWNPPWSENEGDTSVNVTFTMNNGARFVYNASWVAQGDFADWNGNWLLEGDEGSLRLSCLLYTSPSPRD